MYGGSGTWPMASTASSSGEPSSVQRRTTRRPKPALEDLAVDGVNSFKHHPRPRFQFLPRVHQRLPELRGQTRSDPDVL